VLCRLFGCKVKIRNMGMMATREIQCRRIRIRKQVGGVGFVIAMRTGEEERRVYCNAVGIWVKEGGEPCGERWRPHRRWGLLKVVLASKE
jgi:hypothetical protein